MAITVTEYREGAWFKNNFAKVFSACNYYAGVAIQLVILCLSGLYEASQRYKNWYGRTLDRRKDTCNYIAGIQFKFSS